MKRFCVFIVLAILMIGSLAAQSAAADAQRIVGTWTQVHSLMRDFDLPAGSIWTFNANGTGNLTGGSINENFTFGISAGGNFYFTISGDTRTLFFSPDGRRMFIGWWEFQRR